jgi:hypothetical protein
MNDACHFYLNLLITIRNPLQIPLISVPTYSHGQLAARGAPIPTYPLSGAEFRERPPRAPARAAVPAYPRAAPTCPTAIPTLTKDFPIAAVTYLRIETQPWAQEHNPGQLGHFRPP